MGPKLCHVLDGHRVSCTIGVTQHYNAVVLMIPVLNALVIVLSIL